MACGRRGGVNKAAAELVDAASLVLAATGFLRPGVEGLGGILQSCINYL